MDAWLSHTLTAFFAAIAASGGTMFVGLKRAKTNDWQSLVDALSNRVVTLENRVASCEADRAAQGARLAVLEDRLVRHMGPI